VLKNSPWSTNPTPSTVLAAFEIAMTADHEGRGAETLRVERGSMVHE
jgi:hypothetical protein